MHLLQSEQWRKVKENLGNKTYSVGDYFFQTTKLPFLNKFVGYMPRVDLNKVDWQLLYSEAKKADCVYVAIDPENLKSEIRKKLQTTNYKLQTGEATQIQGNVILDLTKPEEELLANMKQKHRYNLKLGQKKGGVVKIEDSEEALDMMLKLHEETVERQKYKDRSSEYIRTVWRTINQMPNARCFIATAYYSEENSTLDTRHSEMVALSSWFIVTYGDTVYYLYGGSSDQHTNVMATYVLVWEIIKWAKGRGLSKFDFMGVDENLNDGYSRFKAGFGGEIIKYEDTVDLIIDPLLYRIIKLFRGFVK